jgi:hypothetical protein
MDRPDARAREHRDRQLRDHRQVEGDPISLSDAETFQDVREPADFAMELAVGEHALVAGLPLPDDRRLVAPRAVQVTVETVDRDVELPPDEPLRFGRLPVEDLFPGANQESSRAKPLPELLEVRSALR